MGKKKETDVSVGGAPAVMEAAQRMVTTAPRGLNLRAGPGTGFEVGAVLPQGTEVQVLPLRSEGPQGVFDIHIPGWAFVFAAASGASQGMTGWVDLHFCQPEG